MTRSTRSTRSTRHAAGLLAAALGCTLAGPALGGAAAHASPASPRPAARVSGSLLVRPSAYVGGQALTLTGRLGVAGRRPLHLQQYMGRPGDIWFPVRDYAGWSATDGSFRSRVPAPDMVGIRYRVVSGSIVTPSVLLDAKVQAADLWVSGADPADRSQAAAPSAGVPFGVSVDTTPDIGGRSYALGTPVFAGRVLTLQKRVTPTSWATLARTTERPDGSGRFTGITETVPGTVVYRVRQEALSADGDRIGWSTSFPAYVQVAGTAGNRQEPAAPGTARYDAWTPLAPSGTALAPTMRTASSGYGWGRKLFDFDWERGQSLGDAPGRGTGHWAEYSDGTGRAAKLNGMLTLDAKRENRAGPGDLGTTMTTLVGNARAYGRWEARMNVKQHEATDRDYDLRLELVPALASQYACGSRTILVGQLRAHSDSLTIGVKNGTRNWSLTRRLTSVSGYPALAVEVEPGHVTWFYAGHPIGTVRSAYAVSDVPLTLRLSQVGRGSEEMNQTVLGSDWQRGWGPTSGRQVLTGPPLRYGVQPNRCDS